MSTFYETLTVNDAYLASNKRPRQRITRACDQCHELRTRCNGKMPCSRCVELSMSCEYNRRPKKRGKASWRRSASPPKTTHDPEAGQRSNEAGSKNVPSGELASEPSQDESSATAGRRSPPLAASLPPQGMLDDRDHANGNFEMVENMSSGPNEPQSREILPSVGGAGDLTMSGTDHLQTQTPADLHSLASFKMPQQRIPDEFEYHSLPSPANMNAFGVTTPSPQGSGSLDNFLQGTNFSDTTPFARNALPWQSNQSPRPFRLENDHGSLIAADMKMKYTVLAPLMPHLINIISLSLANELLEYYFATFSGSSTHPLSPYIQTFILRKNSILHPSNPRRCTPALLSSMLWLAAQTSEAPALTDGPSSRTRITQKLLDLTLDLLKPLRHPAEGRAGQRGDLRAGDGSGDHAYGSPGDANPRSTGGNESRPSLHIDILMTYVHLATVFAASEHKGSSIRWWSIAWSMARDLKLNKEFPYPTPDKDSDEMQGSGYTEPHGNMSSPSLEITEEEREERRRIWWLLYMCDRHLSLCYNQPLFLTDVECETLMQPLDERIWRHARSDELEQILLNSNNRARGPQTRCQNLSLFGYFMPLMTILGAIIDLIRAKTHPRFGRFSQVNPFWEELVNDINAQLADYYFTLTQLGESHIRMDTAEDALHQRIATAYGNHIMHVMYILLNGKWDPIALLDDEDHWVSSASFRIATKHATEAAEVINNIFDDDLDLSFMPWYWGIYLLQGSFLLLFVADKLQDQVAPSILGALRSIIRAHEACAVTLDNEYQRNFRKIMISAVAQIKGRRTETEDSNLLQQRRREVLSLYRWTGSGGGLAL